ncbi:MAG: DUF4417 domain-containing protein [Acidobacteriota bacterium]
MSENIELHRMDGDTVSLWCQGCGLLYLCGGNTRVGGGWCEGRCNGCAADCDLICLGKPDVLNDAFIEVGGFDFDDIGPLNVPTEALPRYLPLIQHGSSRARSLRADWAAVPLSGLIQHPRGIPTPIAMSRSAIRERFKLRPTAKLLLVGIGLDDVIERYWGDRNEEIFASLAKMGFSGAIVPNYSFSLRHPRPQHLYNRKRSLVCAREWSARGIPIIPYLQAVTLRDWQYWLEFLETHEEITMVSKEFQTGLANPARGRDALHHLARLQDALKRPLHLVAVGAAQFRGEISRLFTDWTISDSRPFMNSIKRKRARLMSRRIKWEGVDPEANRLVDALLTCNIAAYKQWIDRPFIPAKPSPGGSRTLEASPSQLRIAL